MTATVMKINLARRERQVLEGLADGRTLARVASDLTVKTGTATGYLRHARTKLYGASETEAALAIAYATEAITLPEPLDPEGLDLSAEQRDLVPLIARGMSVTEMGTELKRPLDQIRSDSQQLLRNLDAKNRVHAVTRLWQYRMLTADQVIAWLR